RPDSNRRRPAWEIYRGRSAGIPRYTLREVSERASCPKRPGRGSSTNVLSENLSEPLPASRAASPQSHSANPATAEPPPASRSAAQPHQRCPASLAASLTQNQRGAREVK